MSQISAWLVYAAFCAGLVYGSLLITIGYLRSVALAVPNHRSGHTIPTPQGAGLVVIPVAVLGAAVPLWTIGGQLPVGTLAAWTAGFSALALMLVGFKDDVRAIGIGTRLAVQAAAVGAVMLALPPEFRIAPTFFPLMAERLFAFMALLWFVNVVNFMDGMDWMSAVETVAITAGVIALAFFGFIDSSLGWCAAALMGAVLGFMPLNAHPARIFLGDAGSLPLGLLLGLLLLNVASQAPAAALILPLYYLADATVTLGCRVLKRKRFWESHREHFYQSALRKGWSVQRILAWHASLQIFLVSLAMYISAQQDPNILMMVIGLAVFAVAGTLWAYSPRATHPLPPANYT